MQPRPEVVRGAARRLVALSALAAALLTARAPAAQPLRVVTYNLLHGGLLSELSGSDGALEERLRLALEGLRSLDADVIALQEASTGPRRGHVAARLARALGYHHAYAPAALRPFASERAQRGLAAALRFTEGPAILSRFPILEWTAYEVPYCGRPFDTRIALFAEILTPAGRLPVVSTHISGDVCQARAVAELVRGRQGNRTALVLGDFNAGEDDEPIRLLREAAGFVDAFRRANPEAPGFTAGQAIRAPRPTASRRIDYVFLAPGQSTVAQVVRSRVVLREPRPDGPILWPSDHYGVLVDLVLEPGRAPLVAGGAPEPRPAPPRAAVPDPR